VLKGVVWDLGYFGDQSLYRIKLPSGALVQVSASEPAALGEPQRRMGRRESTCPGTIQSTILLRE
jgi:hypothetical protein